MSGNYAKRGRGSYNPNSREAFRQERKSQNSPNNSNNNFDSENTVQQKCTRIITENTMDEDYVANDQMANVGKDSPSSSPQQNISGENTSTSSRKILLRPLCLVMSHLLVMWTRQCMHL
ncbi:hypothetical protein RhiirA4_478404 [Rhizophagus irregularis]|uniref:Uncharacterized protein n=1 Tax=Rhizophagus irregularis TaxID=588596 RepID=A0A2I1HET9_9GLOM|nr:hypothetical protein RhiirA4_478404 [Rhizophagus irregularis]